MNPMQTILTKDHVKVLIEIIPKSKEAKSFFPPMDSKAHIEYLNELCTEMQKEVLNLEDEALGLSSIKRHLKHCARVDQGLLTVPAPSTIAAAFGASNISASMRKLSGLSANEDEQVPNAGQPRSRRLSIKTSLGWNEDLGS